MAGKVKALTARSGQKNQRESRHSAGLCHDVESEYGNVVFYITNVVFYRMAETNDVMSLSQSKKQYSTQRQDQGSTFETLKEAKQLVINAGPKPRPAKIIIETKVGK